MINKISMEMVMDMEIGSKELKIKQKGYIVRGKFHI